MLAAPMLALSGMLLAIVFSSVGTAASTYMVAETYLGGTLTAQQAFERATPFIGRLIGVSLMSGVLYMVGLLLFIIPGVIFVCGFIVSSSALVLESLPSATSAMQRSWHLTRGHRGRIFGALCVAFLLLLVPLVSLAGLAGIAAGITQNDQLGLLLAVIVQSILSLLVYPFIYVAVTLLYYDLRVRKEGYDLEMLATSVQQA
jgi:hypothetical protein